MQTLQNKPEHEVVPEDMQAGVMKELGAKWMVAFYDYVSSHPDLVVNGFKEAGIMHAPEKCAVAPPQHNGTLSDEDDTEDLI